MIISEDDELNLEKENTRNFKEKERANEKIQKYSIESDMTKKQII